MARCVCVCYESVCSLQFSFIHLAMHSLYSNADEDTNYDDAGDDDEESKVTAGTGNLHNKRPQNRRHNFPSNLGSPFKHS